MSEFKKLLKEIGRGHEGGRTLTTEEAKDAFLAILDGEVSDIELGAFLSILRYRTETIDELVGFSEAIKERLDFYLPGVKAKNEAGSGYIEAISPYNGKSRTMHILPSAFYIAVAAGVKVLTHVSEKVPAKCAPTFYDVVHIMYEMSGTEFHFHASLRCDDFAIVHQATYSKKLFELLPIRRDFHMRSFINTIEKSFNLFNGKRLLTSVFHEPYFKSQLELSKRMGFTNVTLIKGVEGGIEPSPIKGTEILFYNDGKESRQTISPADIGIDPLRTIPESLDTIKEEARVNLEILNGNGDKGLTDWSLYTAALLVLTAGGSDTLLNAYKLCRNVLENGEAVQVFKGQRGELSIG